MCLLATFNANKIKSIESKKKKLCGICQIWYNFQNIFLTFYYLDLKKLHTWQNSCQKCYYLIEKGQVKRSVIPCSKIYHIFCHKK